MSTDLVFADYADGSADPTSIFYQFTIEKKSSKRCLTFQFGTLGDVHGFQQVY
jgi:hypothetical protein